MPSPGPSRVTLAAGCHRATVVGVRDYVAAKCEVAQGTDMREHVLLFCLLGLVLTATIILVTAPGAVTWALALIE